MECVALHTTTNYFYVMIMRPDAWTFYYPTNVGTPVITRESVSLHENGEGEVVCQAASISSQQLTPSQPGYLTVHSKCVCVCVCVCACVCVYVCVCVSVWV